MAAESSASPSAPPSLTALRRAIPAHCFAPSTLKSSWFVVRDLSLLLGLFVAATHIPLVEPLPLRVAAWTVYGFVQGLVFVGVWILAHECGHGALFRTAAANNTVGWLLHSMVLVPFFSWKYSHARHHIYHNHMDKDTAFVPHAGSQRSMMQSLSRWLHLAEDSPLLASALLVGHQLLGWPSYMLAYVSAGLDSMPRKTAATAFSWSHLDPSSAVFTAKEAFFVLLSDVGLGLALACVWGLAQRYGTQTALLMYGLPYIWVNHWIVAITYLHHTHADAPHFQQGRWTYLDGALSTVDRDFGFIGEHVFHGIIEFHVIHHLFPKIPFYYAEEATEAVKPLLGRRYIQEKSNFVYDLWNTFRTCQRVAEHQENAGVLHWVKQESS